MEHLELPFFVILLIFYFTLNRYFIPIRNWNPCTG